jgi:Ca-activated chloride channel homolog
VKTYLALPISVLIGATTIGAQFATRIDAVRVDVLVTDNGKVVPGLSPADFEVRDNGVLQQVSLASLEEIPVNVVLALDMSASLDTKQLAHLRAAGKTLLSGLRPDDRAALVSFSHVIRQNAPLTADFDLIRTALDTAIASGRTSLIDASFAGMMIGESDVGRSLLIVFSDGVDTNSSLDADAVLDIAKRCDVVVYGVEIGRRRFSFPRELSVITGGRLIEIESTKDMSVTFDRIVDEFRHRYLLSFAPQGVAPENWHSLEVRVRGRSLKVQARPGYFADQRARQ